MNRFRAFAALLTVLALAGCDENAVQQIDGPPAGSWVKFFNFGVNAPQVNFYAGPTKMTAISSTTGIESTIGVGYGSVGSGGFYGSIQPGTYDFAGKIAATVDKDLAIATVNQAVVDGKAYSFYLSGIYNTTTKTSDGFIVEDNFPAAFDYTQAYVRFVHAISNANPLTLDATNTTTAAVVTIGTEVAYKGATAFVAVPAGVYNLTTRYSGAGTNAPARTAVSFVAGKVYTIGARGDITVVSTTLTNRPFLDNTTNR